MNRELQEHFDRLKGLFAQPDHEPRPNPFDKNGRMWTRNFPKRCASCGDTFYAFIPEDALWEPHCVDPEPRDGQGLRGTCGHPLCKTAEQDHQDKRNPKIRAAAEAQSKLPMPEPKRGGFQKAGTR